jgi:uncharacterized membrane protein YqgA involved in biofilm formation
MSPFFKNILAVIIGALIGSLVNGGIIAISGSIIPPPQGADLTTEIGLKSAMSIMEPKHFLLPFLAHALGTLIGAMITARIAAYKKMLLAMSIGALFLSGGIAAVIMLPSPLWFTLVDLLIAYLPMAYIGAKISLKK